MEDSDREDGRPGEALARAIRAEDELERFFALSTDLFCVAGFDGFFRRVNPAFEELMGYPPGELLRLPFSSLVHPDDRAATASEMHSLAGGAHTVRFENRYRRADGSYVWLQWTSMPELDRGAIYAVARDVTAAKEAETELRTLLAAQAALRRVATAVAREGDRAEVFSLVTAEVARLLEADSSNVVRYGDDDRALVLGGWTGPGAVPLPDGSLLRLEPETVTGSVYRERRPVRIDHFGGPPGSWAAHLAGLGVRAAVGAPIIAGGLWGAIIAARTRDEPWPEGAERQLGEFAELIGQALANADAREQLAASRARIVAASDAERRRLERDLHDGAQQRLLALALSLRLAEARLPDDPDGAQALIAEGREELNLALGELRELARGIHPAMLAERGLEHALRAVADRTPLPVDLATVPEGRLPGPVEAAVYYLVAEALANASRYAHASGASVAVTRDGERLVVEVRDDGVGGAEPEAGTGLRGLADRIASLGGRLDVRSPPLAGTVVRAEIPLQATPAGVPVAAAPRT